MSARGGGQELLGPGAALSSQCSFTEQAGSSRDFFFAPVKPERVQKLPRRIAWKKPSLLLMQPLRLQRETLGTAVLGQDWLAPSPSAWGHWLQRHLCLLWTTPAHPSCSAASPTRLLQPSQKVFQLGLHAEHGFKPTALGVSPAYVNSLWTKITSSVEELF